MWEKLKSLFRPTDSLYARIGGKAALDVAVDIFYRKVLDDPFVRYFFEDVDIDAQRAKQKRFLSMVCGGPHRYTGKQIREAHAHLLPLGLNGEHFDRVVEHLQAALEECKVAPADLADILHAAASYRAEVLGE
jgi:hemoglobin